MVERRLCSITHADVNLLRAPQLGARPRALGAIKTEILITTQTA